MKTILLNADFYALLYVVPLGILIIFLILYAEYRLLKYFLNFYSDDRKIFNAVFLSNSASAILGFLLPKYLDHNNYERLSFVQFCLAAFVISIIAETLVNILVLKKDCSTAKIVKATFFTNLITNVAASVIIGISFFGK